MLRDPNVSGGVMPGRRAQRICQGGTSGPSGIAVRNVTERDKAGGHLRHSADSHGTTHVRTYMHMGSSVRSQACVWIRNCHPPQTSTRGWCLDV